MNKSEKDNLTTVSRDIEEAILPVQSKFFRHFVLHEKGGK